MKTRMRPIYGAGGRTGSGPRHKSALILWEILDYDGAAMMDELESLKGQQVEIIYNGIAYTGELAGASETEVYLKTSTDWVTLPMTGISAVSKQQSD